MVSTTIVKFLLMVYCRTFSNEIVRAYAQDHFFDVVTNLIGLIAAVLASIFFWWIDPAGAIVVCYLTFNLPYHDFLLQTLKSNTCPHSIKIPTDWIIIWVILVLEGLSSMNFASCMGIIWV